MLSLRFSGKTQCSPCRLLRPGSRVALQSLLFSIRCAFHGFASASAFSLHAPMGCPPARRTRGDANDGHYTFNGIMVLRLEVNLVAEITGFGDPYLFRSFGLPEILDPDETP